MKLLKTLYMSFFVCVFLMSCSSKREIQSDTKTINRPDTLDAVKMTPQGQLIFEAILISKNDASAHFQIKKILEKGRGSIEFQPNEEITISIESFSDQAKEKLNSLTVNQSIKLTGLTKPIKIGQKNPLFNILNIENK